jgi:hypothetical protein
MSCSSSSTSSEMNEEERELAGISPGLIRMSIGYSGTLEQRWSQFENALTRMTQVLPCRSTRYTNLEMSNCCFTVAVPSSINILLC